MASPSSPPAVGNPFMTKRPVVQVVRYVRVTAQGEVLAEDPVNLVRFFTRTSFGKTVPAISPVQPSLRTFPNAARSLQSF